MTNHILPRNAKYDPVTGKPLKAPLGINGNPDAYHILRRLVALGVEVPEDVAQFLAKVDKLRERLARPEATPLPLPPTDAEQDAFTAYQGSLVRVEADKAERQRTKEQLDHLIHNPGRGRCVRIVLNDNTSELVQGVNAAAQEIVGKSKITDADREKWDKLGHVYIALMRRAASQGTKLGRLLAFDDNRVLSASGNRHHNFRSVPLNFLWDDLGMVFDNPEEAVSTATLNMITGFPNLSDVVLSREAGFNLATPEAAIQLARYRNAVEIKSNLKWAAPEAVINYLDKQIDAHGAVDPGYLFN